MSSADDMESRVAELEAKLEALSGTATDLNVVWVVISSVLVFFMQVGFAMLEVGSVSPKNTKGVLLKNVGDASLGALCWWLVGFALAFGKDKHGFIGTDIFALKGGVDYVGTEGLKEAEWMFNWAFAATSVTIVSGAIAERVKIAAYVMYAIVLTSFIYPLVVHWTWHKDGWASPYRKHDEGLPLLAGCGAVDFAGSAVVHMVGGTAALVAAIAVKPRRGRFRNGTVCRLPQQSPALQTLGTLILWVGWYAFNAGSAVTVSGGRSAVAARAVVSTTIGPSAGVLVMVVSLKVLEKKFDTRGVNNGILSGLVAVTAGAPLLNPEGAFVIGVISAGVYYTSANLLLKLRIDDVVDAAPVHLFSGIWGMIATGLFATPEGWSLTYGDKGGDRANECCGLFYGCGFSLLFANLALMLVVLAWVGGTSAILFYTIEATVGLRVPENEEMNGMDHTRHSFSTTGSGIAGIKMGGLDAVRRALLLSQQSSRAGSLSGSKHGDLIVSNGKQEMGWGGTHSYDPRAEPRPRSAAHMFGRHLRPREDAAYGGGSISLLRSHTASTVAGFAGGGPAMAAEAVTPSVGRGAAQGFNSAGQGLNGAASQGFNSRFGGPQGMPYPSGGDGMEAGGEQAGGARSARWPSNGGETVDLGAPAPAPLPLLAPELGKPKWRRPRLDNHEDWVSREAKREDV